MRGASRWGAWVLTALVTLPAWGSDPQSYKVRVEGSAPGDIGTTLAASSDLVTLRTSAPVSPLGLILRARGDTVRLKTVLESFGYYQSAVTATIDGEALITADLADKLAALPSGKDATVIVSYVPGPLYHLGKVSIEGDLPEAMRPLLNLHSGEPAAAAEVLNAGTRLLAALQDQGYAFAKVEAPVAYLQPDTKELDVSFLVTLGKVARVGTIDVTGLRRTRKSTVLARLGMHSGDQYSAQAIERARRALLAMGVFGTVEVNVAAAAASDGSVPITFKLTERKRHAVTLGAAYSTDLGGRGGVTWTDRNLFGHAEQLSVTANVINLNGSATDGTGYDTGAQLTLPEFLHSQQNLQFSLTALKQSLVAYDQTAETAGFTLSRDLSKVWSVSAGFTTTIDKIYQPQELLVTDSSGYLDKSTFYYTLFALPLSVRYDSTDLSSPLLDPTHGIRAALTVAPTLSLGPPNATYVISQFRASAYLDLHDFSWTEPGRTVIAVRGLYGYAQGANVLDLPPDQRFYAGGSGTVRGYRFQSVGPQFGTLFCPQKPGPDPFPAGASLQVESAYAHFCGTPPPPGAMQFNSSFSANTPTGGVSVDAASVELRQRVGRNYGFAVFMDAGRVGSSPLPLNGAISFGIGAGMRYYTPIGPLRVDFALPLRHSPTDDRFEIYIGLGQSF